MKATREAAGPPAPDAPAETTLVRGGHGYPDALLALRDPPARLFVRGALPDPARAIAIVGSRAASGYGLGVARRLASDLARRGVAVVSGLARGIDTAAHEGALEAGGPTLAVLAFPLERVPRPALPLAERIARAGALATELDAAAVTRRGTFVERNRLIAALAAGVVVVEAAERSGALSTAAAARRLGRPVLAVPGDLDRPTSAGTNALLRDGARACLAAGDARLLARLARGECSADVLAADLGLAAGEILARLLALEWAGLAERRPGPRWRARRPAAR